MSLKSLLIGLFVTFAAPWLILVVRPYGVLAKLAPVPYVEEDGDESTGFFPPARVSAAQRGQEIYFSQGCAQCHTQVIRPQYVGGDGDEYKMGWGEFQNNLAPKATRQTSPYDYLGESFAAVGQRRNGPDLSNAAFRFSSRKEVLEHLFDPRARNEWSVCPSQRHLFTTRKAGQGSSLAVGTASKHAAESGEEIVPSTAALDLADYILSLKRNYPLPVSLGGAKPAPPAAAPAAAPTAAAPAK